MSKIVEEPDYKKVPMIPDIQNSSPKQCTGDLDQLYIDAVERERENLLSR